MTEQKSKQTPQPKRTEPLHAERIDVAPEKLKKQGKVRRFLGKAAMATVLTIPVADLTLSDAWTAKQYEVVTERINLKSGAAESAAENGLLAGMGIAESVALGQLISRNKKLRNSFNDFDEYVEDKQSRMSPTRRKVSKVVNAPYRAIEKVADKFGTWGERAEKHKSKAVRKVGKLAVDTAQVNVMGTSGMIMQETMAGSPTSMKRQAYLGALIMGSWLPVAEGIRQVYRNIPVTQSPLAAAGRAYETLTSMDIADPVSTPVSSIAITGTVAALAYTGWKIEAFRQRREELTAVDLMQVQEATQAYFN